VSVLINRGDGGFNPPVQYKTSSYHAGSSYYSSIFLDYAVEAVDVDNDGFCDMVVSFPFGEDIFVYKNKGVGTFEPYKSYVIGENPSEVMISDVNNDGYIDLLLCHEDGNIVTVLVNAGYGGYDFSFKLEVDGEASYQPTACDMDMDGKVDILVPVQYFNSNGKVAVFINDGEDSFNLPVYYVAGKTPMNIKASDITGDGYPDMLVVNYSSCNISTLFNNGDGTFAELSLKYPVTYNPIQVIADDITGDGIPDMIVVSGNNSNSKVDIFFNNGYGFFKSNRFFEYDNILKRITTCDIDNDGSMDFIMSYLDRSRFLVFRNNGTGGFLPHGEYKLEDLDDLKQITAADVNNDGYDDIITTGCGDYPNENHYVVVMYNQRNGTFGFLPDDKTSPQVSFVNIKNGMKVSGDVLIKIDASDANGIDKVELRLNDSQWLSCTKIGFYWDFLWGTSTFQDVKHIKIQARAIDKSTNANIGYTEEIEVEVFKWTSTDLYVDAVNGYDYNSGTSIDDAFKTITVAFNRVVSSEDNPVTIHLAPGNYNEASGEKFPIELKSFITLMGDDRDAVTIASATFAFDLSVINCMNIQNSSVENLTLTVGDISSYKSGKFYSLGVKIKGSSFKIKDCVIKDFSGIDGFAINAIDSEVEISGCKISNNKATNLTYEGSVLNFRNTIVVIDDTEMSKNKTQNNIIHCEKSTIEISVCDIKENIGENSDTFLIEDTKTHILNCTFNNNNSEAIVIYGGKEVTIENCDFKGDKETGIYSKYQNKLSIINCHISECKNSGIKLSSIDSTLIKDCIIENNRNGIMANESSITIEDSIIRDNESTSGGGIRLYNANAIINRCEIRDNKATGYTYWGEYYEGVGGGVYVYGSEQFGIYNSQIIGNTADYGGGIHFVFNKQSLAEIVNCLLMGNSAERYGGAVHSTLSSINIQNCTIVNNSAEIVEGGVSIDSYDATIKNCILWNNPGGSIGGNVSTTLNYSCVDGGYEGVGNINSDPLFVSGPWGDYYLSQDAAGQAWTSPCVDRGDESAPIIGFDRLWMTTRSDGVFDTD
ncbi:VCBS repeat-containing protein, partial [bacterium]|nr:VCBS repeat-containing protein [bacterium]